MGRRTDNTTTAQTRGDRYVARVNVGKLDVERFTDGLNQWARAGYRLHSVFEQNGNTVMIFEQEHQVAPPPQPQAAAWA